MAFATAAPEETIASEKWNAVVGAFNGTATLGQPVLLTQFDSDSSYALTVRNLGTGGVAPFQSSAGVDILTVTDGGMAADLMMAAGTNTGAIKMRTTGSGASTTGTFEGPRD